MTTRFYIAAPGYLGFELLRLEGDSPELVADRAGWEGDLYVAAGGSCMAVGGLIWRPRSPIPSDAVLVDIRPEDSRVPCRFAPKSLAELHGWAEVEIEPWSPARSEIPSLAQLHLFAPKPETLTTGDRHA